MQIKAISEENSKSLHRQLLHKLRQLALTAEPGSRFPSEQSISSKYNVSKSTVSRVYNELEAAGYLIRKRGSGTFVPEQPVFRICFLLPFDDINDNHDTTLVIRGETLRKRCQELKIPFEYIQASPSRNSREMNTEQFKLIGKNTVLVISGYFFRKLFDQLLQQNSKVVFITAQHELDALYHERLKKWQLIEIDRRGGMVKLVTEMVNQGCRNIAVIHNLPHYQHPLLRGYRLGLRLNKLEYKPQLMINIIGGAEYVQRRLDTLFELKSIYPFDAVIILSESLAVKISQAWENMEEYAKTSVKMAVVSNDPPQQTFPFEVLHLHQPSPETIIEYVMTASALNSPPVKRVIPLEITRLPAKNTL